MGFKSAFKGLILITSETCVTTTRDMTGLEAADMHFLRSVKGYTKDTQDVRSKHKQNWINHLKRMDNTRLPKHALHYKPRGRRDRGRPRKRWQHVDAGKGQSTNPWRKMTMITKFLFIYSTVFYGIPTEILQNPN